MAAAAAAAATAATDNNSSSSSNSAPAAAPALPALPELPWNPEGTDLCMLTEESLLTLPRMEVLLVHPGAGGIATFVGTTRDNFKGRSVTTLEYEAYGPLAVKEMYGIVARIRAERDMWDGSQIFKCVILHRLGVVPVGEASVAIGVSAEHRKEALQACAWAIDTLKARVPIWKKELYGDGSSASMHAGAGNGSSSSSSSCSSKPASAWKQNKEFDPASLIQNQ